MMAYKESAIYMVLERIFKMLSQLAVLVVLAREFGPAESGRFSFLYAIVTLFVSLNNFGLDTYAVKRFILKSKNIDIVIINVLVLRCLSALVSVFFICLIALFFLKEEGGVLLVILSLIHLSMPLSTVDWYFQSKGAAKYSSIAYIFGYGLGLAVKIFIICTGGSIAELCWAYSIDGLVSGLMLFFFYKRNKRFCFDKVRFRYVLILANRVKPLVIYGFIVALYMKVDQLVIGGYLGDYSVGLYSAASRLVEACFFVCMALINAYFPKIISYYSVDNFELFERELVKHCKLLVIGSIVFCVVISFASPKIIALFYGDKFADAALILSILIWSVPSVILGLIATKLYILFGQEVAVLNRAVAGLVVSLVLSVFLVFNYGLVGVSVAFLLSQLISSYFMNYFISNAKVFRLQNKMFI